MNINNIVSDIELKNLIRLNEKINIWWWQYDTQASQFQLSTQFSSKAGLTKSTFTLDEFTQLIRSDYRREFTENIKLVLDNRLNNLEVPFDFVHRAETQEDSLWIEMDILERDKTDNSTTTIFGKISLINNNRSKSASIDVNELISKQNTLSYSLLAFQKEGSLEDVVNHILEDIIKVFGCSRTYVFLYDFEQDNQSCIFEAVADGVSREIDFLQNIPISVSPLIASHVLCGKPVVISDVAEIEDDNEREVIEVQNIKSLMISPMFSDGGVIGYIGVDCVDYYRKWTENDAKWISTLANIISVSYDLYSKTEHAMQKSRRMEQAWETNEAKFKSIVDNVPVGIEIYDKNGILIFINDTEKEIFGVSDASHVYGKNIFENPNIPDFVKEKIVAGEWVDVKIRYEFSNLDNYYMYDTALRDKVKDILYKGGAVYDSEGNISHYLFIAVDNTSTEAAYTQLEEFNRIFSIISDYSKVGFARYNPITKKGIAVRQWYKNLEEDESTDIAQVIGNYKNMHPQDRADVLNYYKMALERKIDCFRMEVRIIKPSGEIKYLFIYVVCTIQPDDSIICSVVNFDITDSKNKETMLIEAKNKAETSDLLKSAFLANMSHEIRTPLNSIIGFSELLAITDDNEEKREYAEIISQNNKQLLNLISDILDLSKIETGSISFEREEIDLQRTLEDIERSMKVNFSFEELRLILQPLSENIIFYSDKMRIVQVITNLISNAVKFTDNGYVAFGANRKGDMIEFYVSDSGCGISECYSEKIFDRFFKLDSFKMGTGIGLSICKMIIEKMGGQIWVESRVDIGSTFRFTIPLNDA